MRALLLLLSLSFVVSCAHKPPVQLDLSARPTPLPTELFDCGKEPAVWPAGASDAQIASSVREYAAWGKACHRSLITVCKIAQLNDLLVKDGVCPS